MQRTPFLTQYPVAHTMCPPRHSSRVSPSKKAGSGSTGFAAETFRIPAKTWNPSCTIFPAYKARRTSSKLFRNQ